MIQTIRDFSKKKQQNEPIVLSTAYDYLTARILAESQVDALLVGDSLGTVLQGEETTLPVSMDEMVYHTRIVKKGIGDTRKFLIADMPFASYQCGEDQAVWNASRLLKAGAQAVKIEGNFPRLIARLCRSSIPVMGHLGLTPQSIHQIGGYIVQGKTREEQNDLLSQAKEIEQAGAFAIVLELMTAECAQRITKSLSIPTIGIGAGPHTSGQVLVFHDLVGLLPNFQPKFVKRYFDGYSQFLKAINRFAQEVKERTFPSIEHSFYQNP